MESEELFRGVMLTRPGLVGLLAEGGATLTVWGPDQTGPGMAGLLVEARRCGLSALATVVNEWPDPDSTTDGWVTVWG